MIAAVVLGAAASASARRDARLAAQGGRVTGIYQAVYTGQPGDPTTEVWAVTPECQRGPCSFSATIRGKGRFGSGRVFPFTLSGSTYTNDADLGYWDCVRPDNSVLVARGYHRSIVVTIHGVQTSPGGTRVTVLSGSAVTYWQPTALARARGCRPDVVHEHVRVHAARP